MILKVDALPHFLYNAYVDLLGGGMQVLQTNTDNVTRFPMGDKIKQLMLWRDISAYTVQKFGFDITNRQVLVMLSVYLEPGFHSVKSLSELLGISKPAICRALDQLSKAGLVKRKRDDADRRIVYLQRTVKGSVTLSEFSELLSNLQS